MTAPSRPRRANRVKLAAFCGIVLCMAAISSRATQQAIARLAHSPACALGLDWLDKNGAWVTEQHIHLVEIPAPAFNEAPRAEFLKQLFESTGLHVRTDSVGNVIAERPGADANSVILFAAHLDTVFPAGTDVHVNREDDLLKAPGIGDDGAGLASLVAVARALSESRVRTAKTLVFAGDVGEEGEGNLRGIKALAESYGSRLAAVIAVDGASTMPITTQGVASRRFEVTVTGPGGHSWADFDAPNPITAISRGIVRFSSVRIPASPRTTYNFGVIEGGTSVNSIPASASLKVDLRSEEESELARLETALRDAMDAGARDEISATHSTPGALQLNFRSLGARPAGKLPADSPLLATVLDVDAYLGISSRPESGSTDANIPLALGIPALAVGGGGKAGGAHTLGEWFDPTDRELGLKRLYLIALALAGLQQ